MPVSLLLSEQLEDDSLQEFFYVYLAVVARPFPQKVYFLFYLFEVKKGSGITGEFLVVGVFYAHGGYVLQGLGHRPSYPLLYCLDTGGGLLGLAFAMIVLA